MKLIGGANILELVTTEEVATGQCVAMTEKCDAQCRVANGSMMGYTIMPVEDQLA